MSEPREEYIQAIRTFETAMRDIDAKYGMYAKCIISDERIRISTIGSVFSVTRYERRVNLDEIVVNEVV